MVDEPTSDSLADRPVSSVWFHLFILVFYRLSHLDLQQSRANVGCLFLSTRVYVSNIVILSISIEPTSHAWQASEKKDSKTLMSA